MANTRSSKKAILVNERNRRRNINFKSRMRTTIKKALHSMQTNDKDTPELIKVACQLIDKTAAKGIIKKGTASRNKSRLMHKLNKAEIKSESEVTKPKKVTKKKIEKPTEKSVDKKAPKKSKEVKETTAK